MDRRVDRSFVLSLCGDAPRLDRCDDECFMGMDTGKDMHVVILRTDKEDLHHQHLVHPAVCPSFGYLDGLMSRFKIDRCVIDGLPETHATREFVRQYRHKVFMSFFDENQRGEPKWNHPEQKVETNRTEVLDMSRAAIRDQKIIPPRREALLELLAQHMSCDAKELDEDPDTGMKKYRHIRTGEDHFSLAFTYAVLAASNRSGCRGLLAFYRREARERERRRGL